jgi:hypothetical protein
MKNKRKTMMSVVGVIAAAALALPAMGAPTLPPPGVPPITIDPIETAPLDLTYNGPTAGYMPGFNETGPAGSAIIADYWEQPTGTGVFDPFLTLDANGQTSTENNNIEQAYNVPGFFPGDGGPPNSIFPHLDQLRPNWNTMLTLGDLANIDGYYAFILDANEKGNRHDRLISIDNIRVYTSDSDAFAESGNPNDLGTLRWAMNEPLAGDMDGFNVDQWILLDASQENVDSNANGGSGQGDMVVFIPVSAFDGAEATDNVWFYNLNGVHYEAELSDTDGADAGFEEWRAVMRVPDGGSTLILLGLGMAGFAAMRRRLR